MKVRWAYSCLFAIALAGCNCGARLVPLRGVIAALPESVDFGSAPQGTTVRRSVSLSNSGSTAIHVVDLALDGADSSSFTFEAAAPFDLTAGASQTVGLAWSPTRTGDPVARLLVHSDAENTDELAIPLSGHARSPSDPALDAGPIDEGSRDAGADGGLELPVFDGGGPCGATNVIDVDFLPSTYVSENAIAAATDSFEVCSAAGAGTVADPAHVTCTRLTLAGTPVDVPRDLPLGGLLIDDLAHLGLAWSGSEFGVAYPLDSDAGPVASYERRIAFQRLDAMGAPIPSSERVTGVVPTSGLLGQDVTWNAGREEWGLAWGEQNLAFGIHPSAHLRRIAKDGAFVSGETEWADAAFLPFGSALVAVDGGYRLATGNNDASARSGSVRWLAFDPVADAGSQHDLAPGDMLLGSLNAVVGSHTIGLSWTRSFVQSGLVEYTEFTVVDVDGNPIAGAPIHRLPPGAILAESLAWNGTEYVLVYTSVEGDAGTYVGETRFLESGAVSMPARLLTCVGFAREPHIAYAHGVHMVVYTRVDPQNEANDDQRLLLMK
jgi:hypothetical protein